MEEVARSDGGGYYDKNFGLTFLLEQKSKQKIQGCKQIP